LTSSLRLAAEERVTLGAVAGCLVAYFAAWIVYWCGLPAGVFWVLPAAAAVAAVTRRRAVGAILGDPRARHILILWFIFAGWCLGLLALIRTYSGGEWVGDWFEHYQRTLFFLERQPLDTVFLHVYALPARPPLANLIGSALLGLTGTSFAQYQVFSTLLASLVLFPAALFAQRCFRGGNPASALLVLMMMNPLVVQNATFAWTKLPAAFFLLCGMYFFRHPSASGGIRGMASVACLSAAVLTHYSAAPYVLLVAAAWMIQSRPHWGGAGFRPQVLGAAVIGLVLGAAWFGWSIRHYGVGPTFLSNSTVTGSSGLTLAQQAAQRAGNLFNTLIPHPLRRAEYAGIAQASRVSWWRDWFFNLYQTNLPLAFGTGGLVALGVLAWRRRHRRLDFWCWFIPASVLLSLAVTSWPDRWGATHVGLQPLVVLGLAWLAGNLPELSRPWRALLVAGMAADCALGIIWHFILQHWDFPADLFANHGGIALLRLHGYATWNNALSKSVLRLTLVGDLGIPVLPLGLLLAVLFIVAVRRAMGAAAGLPPASAGGTHRGSTLPQPPGIR